MRIFFLIRRFQALKDSLTLTALAVAFKARWTRGASEVGTSGDHFRHRDIGAFGGTRLAVAAVLVAIAQSAAVAASTGAVDLPKALDVGAVRPLARGVVLQRVR